MAAFPDIKGRLGVIAGKGRMPHALLERVLDEKVPLTIAAYVGVTDPELEKVVPPETQFVWAESLGQVGRVMGAFKKAGVTDVVMAGAFQRPSFQSLKVDVKGALWVAGILKLPRGDDALLRYLGRKIQGEGFRMHAFQDFLPTMLAPKGPLGKHSGKVFQADADAGLRLLDALSPFDVGQAVVVEGGWTLGIEGAEGTDRLIRRCGPLLRDKGRAVLIKTAKKGQDHRHDLPVIGPDTLDSMHESGLVGCFYRKGQALLMQPESLKDKADACGLFLEGLS